MAISNNHKLTLLYMMKELLDKTDEQHTMNAAGLIRKEEGHVGYYIGSRDFELPELKLLVDAVRSSKFITEKKSEQLIRKLMKQTNRQKAQELNRSVFIRNRMKTENEKIFYNVDAIHKAINEDRQIAFPYGVILPSKRLAVRKGGAVYTVSPWAVTWDDENYYLIAHDEGDGKIKHFRIDKMIKVTVQEEARNGREDFRDFDLAAFAKKTFGMYGGTDAKITLRCEDHLAGVIIDRFGKDVMMMPDGPGFFRASVLVAVSPQFFGWVTGIGTGMEILSPPGVREEYRKYLDEIAGKYR